MKQLGSTDLKRLHRTWRHRTDARVALVLDRVAQPFNVGSILRTAAAMRVTDVWLVGETPGPEHAKVGKTALGADRYLTFHRVDGDGATAIRQASDHGYRTVALELADGAEPMHELDLAVDACIVVGHEDRGLTASTIDACDLVGFLPQLGRIGSLNVATAASTALYEVRRQAWTAAAPGGPPGSPEV
jgi:tRNA (guanosine-2'-O-)-methyltransferase